MKTSVALGLGLFARLPFAVWVLGLRRALRWQGAQHSRGRAGRRSLCSRECDVTSVVLHHVSNYGTAQAAGPTKEEVGPYKSTGMWTLGYVPPHS